MTEARRRFEATPFTTDVVGHLRAALAGAQVDSPTDQQVDDVIANALMAVAKIDRTPAGKAALERVRSTWAELERIIRD